MEENIQKYSLDYGAIGNCRTAALVSKRGSIDWLCFPNFDSPSIFAKILDEKIGGSFDILVSEEYDCSQRYLQGTNILCTTFTSLEASFEVFDFMPRYRTGYREYYMPAEVYRYIRVLSGAPHIRIKYDPAINYAREAVRHEMKEDYIKTYSMENMDNNVYLYSSMDHEKILSGDEIPLGKEEYLLLSYYQKLVKIDKSRVHLEYQRTKVYWLNWDSRSKSYQKYNHYIHRSLLILKLMSFQDTGCVLAALTTSIPETIGEGRNWDYRFCWIRDASMSIDTLLRMGHESAASRFMGFIKRILSSKSDSFQIMYRLDGSRNLTEEILPHLSGFENSQPVRIGNAAYRQRQNDSLGYLMEVIYNYYVHFPGTLDEVEEMWEIVKTIVRSVFADWRNTDQSIWEFRNQQRHFVFSKVMSWVAMDRASRIANMLNKPEAEQKWREEAERIRDDINVHGWNEEIKSFTQAYDSADVDSSLLLMEYYGFIQPDDERFVSTVHRIKEELYHNGLMYRYKIHDDFGTPSSSFTICTFWLVRALYVIGKEDEAREIFERLLSYSNYLGLFSEDLNFDTKRLLGNFPQAYSHLSLIDTALLFTKEESASRIIKP